MYQEQPKPRSPLRSRWVIAAGVLAGGLIIASALLSRALIEASHNLTRPVALTLHDKTKDMPRHKPKPKYELNRNKIKL